MTRPEPDEAKIQAIGQRIRESKPSTVKCSTCPAEVEPHRLFEGGACFACWRRAQGLPGYL